MGSAFLFGNIRCLLFCRAILVRFVFVRRAHSVMSIFLAVIGAGIWCGAVYMILLFLGVEL